MDNIQLEPQLNSKNEIAPNQNPDKQELGTLNSNSAKFSGPLEKPKTANKAFGSISDFLLFFENRNPEMKEFVKDFQRIEKMESEISIETLNKVIAPQIEQCINEMHKKSGTSLKNRYVGLFANTFETWEKFYNTVLKAYTIAGFLFEKMNEFLRNEDWEKLDDLLPYTYFLFKAFIWGHTALSFSSHFEFLRSQSKENKLILFRGAGFDYESLKFYDKSQIKYFSWNGVTSTSLDESEARVFQSTSATRTAVLITIEVDFANLHPRDLNALYLEGVSNHPKEKEVAFPPGSIFELLQKIEGESEVEIRLKLITNTKILAQQGEFLHGMLQGVMRNEDELKLVCLKEKELSRAIQHYKGNQLGTKLEFCLCHFNEWSVKVVLDVLPTIKNLNLLTFNSVVLEEGCFDPIMKCLGDLKIEKLEVINSLGDEHAIKSFIRCIKYFGSLKMLKLSFEENSQIDGIIIQKLYNEAMRYLDPQCVFELNMINHCDFLVKNLKTSNYIQTFGNRLNKKKITRSESSDEGVPDTLFAKSRGEDRPTRIIYNEQEETKWGKEKFQKTDREKELSEDENPIEQIAESPSQENILTLIGKKEFLEYGLRDNSCFPKITLLEALKDNFTFKDPIISGKQPLETLYLNFQRCPNLCDKDLKSLACEGIQVLQSLKTLNLNFNECSEITDKALKILSSEVLQKLTGLNNLNLSFEKCKKITDEGLKTLACDGIQHLQSLMGLSLSFRGNRALTNKGLRSLALEGIAKIISSLTSLHLNFESCLHITEEGMESLFHNDGFGFLTNLDLNFNNCSKMTNKGIEVLARKGLQKLKKCLKVLNLSFSYSTFEKRSEITDEGLKIFSSEGISHLESLKSLSLSFSGLSKMTDKGIMSLCDQGIQYLSSLTILSLTFDRCERITNEGLESLYFSNELTTLHLSFNDCWEISDDGLDGFSKKLGQLKSLEHLHLSFRNCLKITDHGIELLCSQGIKPLSKLTALHLRFGILFGLYGFDSQTRCITITDQSLKSIGSEAIKHLPELEKLHLEIAGCCKITNKGLEDLCRDGIQHLKKLTDLHLSFLRCEAIMDGGLKTLSRQGLFHLKHSLNALHLDFNECPQLSDMGLNSLLKEGIQHLKQLTTLCLKFGYFGKIKRSQLLQLQYQINLLNLPKLQLPLETLDTFEGKTFDGWKISSPSYQFSNSPSTAFVLCQKRLEFTPEPNTNVLDDIGSQKVENLTLKFEQGPEITDLDISNSLFISDKMKTWKDLKTLHLTFDGCKMITDFTLHNLCSEVLRHLGSLTSLHLSFNECSKITDAGLIDLSRSGIHHLKLLTSLFFNFDGSNITNKGLRKLYDRGFKQLESLKFIHLSFQYCHQITNKGLKRLYHRGIKSLASFLIDFPDTKITKRLKKQISQSSSSFILMSKNSVNNKLIGTSHFIRQKINIDQGLSQIQSISADSVEIVENKMFTRYLGRNHYVFNTHFFQDSDKTYHNFLEIHPTKNVDDILKSAEKDIIALILLSNIPEFEEKAKKLIHKQDGQEISYLESLTSLNLTLGRWTKEITDSIFNTLFLRVFQHLKSLTHLYLCFDGCARVAYLGLKNLGPHGIRYLTSLTTLHLSFKNKIHINDVELKILSSEGIQSLKSLTTLHLDFDMCPGNLDEGLQDLWTDGILHLKSLTTLELSFKCTRITGKGFKNLKEAECLKSLTTLRLNFEVCHDFKDKGVENLCIGLIQHLRELTTLHLKFFANEGITDSSLQYLSSQGICHLKLLQNLHLSFAGCWRITDLGVLSLDLSSFKLLISLYLNFDQCMNLTDQSLANLTFPLAPLEILHLSFRGCSSAITDQALEDLEIQDLTSLEALYLCFDGCEEITDEGIEALSKDKIQSLKLLKTLHLSFAWCEEITEDGLESFYQNAISHLILLQNIQMCFFACREISHAQLSLLKAKIDLPQFQHRSLEIIENTIFSGSYVHHERFLSATLPSQKYLKRLNAGDNNGRYNQDYLSSYGSIFKDYFYYPSKVDTNAMFATLQKPKNSKIVDYEDSFYATDLGLSQSYSSPSDKMENFKDFEALDNFKDIEMLQVEINNSEGIEYLDLKIKSLCRNILQRLKSLKILHLTFEMPHDITDEELRTLGFEGISSLVGLTQLYLSFNRCHRITDQGLVGLSSGGLQNIKQLNVLRLNFNECEKITDRGFTILCSDGIQHLKLLKTLHLSFDGCKKITDEALKSVSLVGILKLSSIQDLQLSFLRCPKISSSSYQAFFKILEYFGYVQVNQDSKKD